MGRAERGRSPAGRIGRAGAAALACALVLAAGATSGARADMGTSAPAPLLAPLRELATVGDLGRPKAARSISGIACATAPGAPVRACIMVGDEPDHVWTVTLTGDALRVEGRIRLRGKGGAGELDLEAAAVARQPDGSLFYYVTGSHGAGRGTARFDPARYGVFRLPGDPAAGTGVAQSRALGGLIRAVPELAGKACAPRRGCVALDDGGVTIEGLAARDGELYFGFRAPVADGRAFVLRVNADALFSGRPGPAAVLRPELGEGFGVRDMAAVEGGFLILAGRAVSDDALEVRTSAIHFWDGRSAATRVLGRLRTAGGAKPEALLVLREAAAGPYRLLVLSDGVPGGAPAVYEVPRP